MTRYLRDVDHLVRLAVLFVAVGLIFLVVRALLVPAGFGDLGHFRPGALLDNRNAPMHFAGREACAECHDDVFAVLGSDTHLAVACESCHGALKPHAEDPGTAKAPAVAIVEMCSRCHAVNAARPKDHPQVEIEPHRDQAACIDCHDAHAPTL